MTTPAVDLTESLNRPFAEAEVSGNLIHGVAVLTASSKNGRRYSRSALEDVVELAQENAVQVFLDHDRGSRERSVKDLAGTLRNPRLAGGVVRGDLQVLDVEAGRLIKAVAEGEPALAGLSIAARGEVEATDEGAVVRAVEWLGSVDVVTEPATTSSLFESLNAGGPEKKEEHFTIEEAYHRLWHRHPYDTTSK